MKREWISIHIGHAGVQIGDSCWRLYCQEHGIQPDGSRQADADKNDDSFKSFFKETRLGTLNPRALFVDLDATTIGELLWSSQLYRNLHSAGQTIEGDEDTGSIFAVGRYTLGKFTVNKVMEKLQTLVDDCVWLEGFLIFYSLGGGTGSGFTSLLMEELHREFYGKIKIGFAIYPSAQFSCACVEPYNAVLATHANIEDFHYIFMFDNEALCDICHQSVGIERPEYKNLNQMMSQVVSSISATMRSSGELERDLGLLRTHLIHYPRVHFPLVSYAPVISTEKAHKDQSSLTEITEACFEQTNQMMICNAKAAKYCPCSVLYRGDVVLKDVQTARDTIKRDRSIKFVDWCPSNSFTYGISYQPPSVIPNSDLAKNDRAVTMLGNTTAFADVWARLNSKFDLMHNKRAFLHWYFVEGMEDEEFIEAREDIETLKKDYEDMG